MRDFIALELPEKIRKVLHDEAKKLKEKNLFYGKVTELENIHLTLKFLGEVNDGKVEQIKNKLKEIKMKKFSAKLDGFGVFSENFIRIIWVKLEGADELQEKIDFALKDLFEKEKRFMGHITIARVKNVEGKNKLINELKKKKFNLSFNVNKFVLKESILKLEGPEYKEIESFNLE